MPILVNITHCLIKNLTQIDLSDGGIGGLYGVYYERKTGFDRGVCSPLSTGGKLKRENQDP
jgi:hypothetical protein